jgi:hypothetical protein
LELEKTGTVVRDYLIWFRAKKAEISVNMIMELRKVKRENCFDELSGFDVSKNFAFWNYT